MNEGPPGPTPREVKHVKDCDDVIAHAKNCDILRNEIRQLHTMSLSRGDEIDR